MNEENKEREQRFEWPRIVEVDVASVEALLGQSYKFRAEEWGRLAKNQRNETDDTDV